MLSDLDVNPLSPLNPLKNIRLALGICSAIGAIETPQIARQLRRYGATVKVYIQKRALNFIGISALEWATLTPPVVRFQASADHIMQEDALLIAPLSMNTTAQIVQGHANSPLCTLAANAIGMQKPLFILPTMHQAMWNNPIFQNNLNQLMAYPNVHLIPPINDENKYKMPPKESIALFIAKHLSQSPMKNQHLLITGGSAPTPIDDVRLLSNHATGQTALALAKEALLDGANVHLLLPHHTPCPPEIRHHANLIPYSHYTDYFKTLQSTLKQYPIHSAIFSAAVSDYHLKDPFPSKSRTHPLKLSLYPTEKIIDTIRQDHPTLKMVVFKYEVKLSHQELLKQGLHYLNKGYNHVFLNQPENLKARHSHANIKRGYLLSKTHASNSKNQPIPISDPLHLYMTLRSSLSPHET